MEGGKQADISPVEKKISKREIRAKFKLNFGHLIKKEMGIIIILNENRLPPIT